MKLFRDTIDERRAERFTAELESALLARALAETGGLPDERAKALLSSWLSGTFNATVFDLRTIGEGRGALAWEPESTGHRLTWYAPTGLVCPLARIYPQADATWAALVVAGVRADEGEAMLAAEWGVSRLTA